MDFRATNDEAKWKKKVDDELPIIRSFIVLLANKGVQAHLIMAASKYMHCDASQPVTLAVQALSVPKNPRDFNAFRCISEAPALAFLRRFAVDPAMAQMIDPSSIPSREVIELCLAGFRNRRKHPQREEDEVP